MCRWAAYLGPETYLEDIISSPCHSLVAQSHDAHEAKTRTNGDGFGVAWYGNRDEPGLYRDILPAWSDQNLRSLARQIQSRLFLAHVRASTGGLTSRSNCHPFVSGRWSFMHNGQIGDFDRLRRRLEGHLSDDVYRQKHGATDSELIFLLMLEFGLDGDPALAMKRMVATIVEEAVRAGVPPFLRLTAAFSDGNQLYAIRYATDDFAPTLYTATLGSASGICVVSEPLDGDKANWMAVPANSFVTVSRQGRIAIDVFEGPISQPRDAVKA
ncbi:MULTISPECIES: class II glutamine amidotransferase [Ochrobactrum]|uniref:class II glutamine amidotransferase n=1 Tax=Ochrobactrum TaxID=528 RepID=UPI002989E3BC|nr:class II glutamine amidotransferase [Ochrobactrum sp. AN78]MDH7793732.1 putative glutamine amidotransferase [Ochrobactrum sp. AN78]